MSNNALLDRFLAISSWQACFSYYSIYRNPDWIMIYI